MTSNYTKTSKQVYSFISTYPKAHLGDESGFECFNSYISFITEPYTKPNYTKAFFKYSKRPRQVSNTHRQVAVYCCPKTYCYVPYNEPKGR